MLSPNDNPERTSPAAAGRHVGRLARRHHLARVSTVAAVAVLALLASACSQEPPPAPPAAVETTTTAAPETTASAPDVASAATAPSPCTDPAAHDLGDGLVELDGTVWEVSADACVPLLEESASGDDSAQAQDDAPALNDAQTVETPATGQVCVDDVCVDVPTDGSPIDLPEGFANHEHPPETEPGYEAGPGAEDPTTADEPEADPTSTDEAESDDSGPEPAVTTTTAAPEPEPAATTSTSSSTTTSTTTTTTTTTVPEPPTTTAPLPDPVGDPITFETDTTTNAPYCSGNDVGCSPLLDIQVGTVLISAEYPANPATVIDVVHSTTSSFAVVWVCVLGANPDVQYGRYRWAANRTDGLYSLHRSTLGDYHGPC